MKPKFKTIKDHACEWADILSSTDVHGRWIKVYDWLKLASGLEAVTVDLSTSTSYMCESAMDYEDRQGRFQSEMLQDLIKFLAVWSSLEALLDDSEIEDTINRTKGRGKIGKACALLKERFADTIPIRGIKTCTDCLGQPKSLELLDVEKRYNDPPSFVPRIGLGLYVVYSLRNSFAHGSYALPDGNMESGELKSRCQLIRLATRIVLLSEQAILLAVSRPDALIDLWWEHDTEETEVCLSSVLPFFHFQDWRTLDLSQEF